VLSLKIRPKIAYFFSYNNKKTEKNVFYFVITTANGKKRQQKQAQKPGIATIIQNTKRNERNQRNYL
jgi:hypothetical protein